MTASIVLTGLSANDPVPGAYLEINFAQGEAAGASAARPILLMGNKTSAGSATADSVIYGPDTATPCQTEADVISLFGAGSELHRMFRRVVKVNRDTAIYFIAVTESAGTAASLTVTLANDATGNGNLRFWCGDEYVDTAITTGDTATVIGAALETNVNAMTHWPITASNSTGTVTMTAKLKGPRGNQIRIRTLITSGIATTATRGAGAVLASGATADSNTTALATILPRRFYYIVSAAGDATQFGALVTQVGTQAAPTTGIRQRAFAGSQDSLSNTNTIATGINSARAEIAWQLNSDLTGAELAANHAAVVALFEAERVPRPLHNFSGFGNDAATQPYWVIPAPLSGSAPTRANIKSALQNGVTPIASNANGTTYMVKRITTRSLSGSTADYRIRDAHKVTVCDFFGDDLIAKTVLNFAGKDLADDPPQGARQPGPQVVTPSRYQAAVFRLINDYDENDQLKNVAAIKAGTIVQRETSPSTRISALIPLQPIDIADTFALMVNQVG